MFPSYYSFNCSDWLKENITIVRFELNTKYLIKTINMYKKFKKKFILLNIYIWMASNFVICDEMFTTMFFRRIS